MAEQRPQIECTENGPYAVRQLQNLEVQGESVAATSTMKLCRCGQSGKKPYCDGSHVRVGFSGARQEDRRPDELDSFVGREIAIHDNRGLCAHAGVCTGNLESVFQFMQETEPRIDADGAAVEEIVDVINRCPSGAISHTLTEAQAAPDEEASVWVIPQGPYVVRGDIELVNAESLQGASSRSRTLCRCGDSKNKPFCDGSHWDSDFDK